MSGRMTRRDFLKRSAGAVCTAGLSSALHCVSRSSKPNVVIIMADDMGFSDLGCYGSSIATPHLDRLAGEGVRFTQFYNAARCCPTRASLLTGLYPHRAGMGAMINRRKNKRPPAYQGHLNAQCLTIAEALKPAGYRTLMSGKWHVGEHRPHWPLDRGFDRYYGLISGASSYFDTGFVAPGTNKVRIMVRDDTEIVERGEDFYMTDAISDHAVKMIDEHGREASPFFMYVAYTAPHWPLHALAEDIEKYRGRFSHGWDAERERRHAGLIEMGLVDPSWPLSRRDERVPPWDLAEHRDWEAMRMAVYAAQIECMDRGIGRILEKLEEVGAEGDTLVLFLADNGGCAEILDWNDPTIMPGGPESYMSYGIGWANVSNTPFRQYKKWVHEGGIASPFIARWPGRIRPDTVSHETAHVIDLMPTCLDAADAAYPEEDNDHKLIPLDGRSLLPVLKGGRRDGHDVLFWEHLGNAAVREGAWKLVMDADLKKWELYNLEEDRTELHNVIEAEPGISDRLTALWNGWAEDVHVWPKTASDDG